MKIFKNKEDKKMYCCTVDTGKIEISDNNDKGIKILGSNCDKCLALEKATRQAVEELNMDIKIEHITDFVQIASYGVMSTPAIVVNGIVKAYGKLLTVSEIKDILSNI